MKNWGIKMEKIKYMKNVLTEEDLGHLVIKQLKSIYLKQKYDPNTLKKGFY